jgi:hypothetical protein
MIDSTRARLRDPADSHMPERIEVAPRAYSFKLVDPKKKGKGSSTSASDEIKDESRNDG